MAKDIIVQDGRKKPFVIVNKSIVKDTEGITKASTLSVYLVLCMYADNHTLEAYPKVETISEYARVGERTVRRELKLLEELGYIRVENRRDARGYQTSNAYILLDK